MMHALIDQLNKAYFWDVDISNLDAGLSRRLIIERVINFGNLEEIKKITDFYGQKQVRSTLCELNYLDPKTLNFVSLLFGIPKSKFKCYSKKPLTSQPWNY